MNNTIKTKPVPVYGIFLFVRDIPSKYPQIVDIYVAPGVDMAQVEDAAAEFGQVENEGHYLRLTINPVFDEDEVTAYLASLWPQHEGDEIQAEPVQEEDADAR